MQLPANAELDFVDDRAIARSASLRRVWAVATLADDPILVPDRAWESRSLGFSTMVAGADGPELFYGGFDGLRSNDAGEQPSQLHRAVSTDGVVWEKPLGEDGTNVVLRTARYSDSPSVILAADGTYRLLQYELDHVDDDLKDLSACGLYAYSSEDGVRWMPSGHGRVIPALDRNTLYQSADGTYHSLNRNLAMFDEWGRRAVYESTSTDFVDWTVPELTLAPDLDDHPDTEFYGLTAFEHLERTWGLLEVWRRDLDVFHLELVHRTSHGWARPARHTPFLTGTTPWSRRWLTGGGGPLITADQLVFTVGARNVAHGWSATTLHGVIATATAGYGRLSGLEATLGGWLETHPFTWHGRAIAVNADTRSVTESHPHRFDGHVRVDVLDESGRPRADWSGDRGGVFVGNTHTRGRAVPGLVDFGGRSLAELAGETVRLRIALTRGRLHTLTILD